MTMMPTRRGVLKTIGGGLGLAGLSTVAGPLSARMAFASGPYSGDVLIVLSMRGGQDGLSVVPRSVTPRITPSGRISESRPRWRCRSAGSSGCIPGWPR